MKRFIIALAVTGVLVCCALFSLVFLKKSSERIADYADSIHYLCENGQTEEALEKADEFSSYWDEISRHLNIFVNTERLSAINSSVCKIRPFIESDSDELISELEGISANAKWLYLCEKPKWYNIF